uniref:Uncharacterized protein n=1 Tax=Branchiostoma floridae TaxID=7739 RepID=C3YPR5_BRAFL|eukprot:XP_002601837.1 hypothetical protein BRAFLDRAFT_75945 [Branchiostoma floridae]
MIENVDAVVTEPKMSGDSEGLSPANKKQSIRRRKTAPGRQELYGRPPEDTQSNKERTTITTHVHAVVHNEPSSPRKEENRRRKTAPGRQELYGRPPEDTQSNDVRERTTIMTHAVVHKEPSSPRKEANKWRKTAPGRQELYGRPPEDTQPNVRERTTVTTHAVVHKEPSSPRKEGAKGTQKAVQTSSSPGQDAELDQLYESRKATAQDAIQHASAQPFYEMDISPADDEQEQPFYKMDVTAAKDKLQKDQPFYEMDVVSAVDGEKAERPFYQMDDNRLDKSASSSNVYADLDPEFVAAQDEACRRHRVREQNRGAENDETKCCQNCRVFSRSRLGCMVAVCVSVILAAITATVVSVVVSRSDDLLNQKTLATTETISSSQLPGTTPTSTTEGRDWQGEWALYIREYFGENRDVATALEESYAANDVVMSLLQDRFFWPWVCRYWALSRSLPCTLAQAVAFCVKSGTFSEYMTSHGLSTYSEFFSSVRNALEALQKVTTSTGSELICVPAVLSLSKHTLSDNDVTALVNLFPYLEWTGKLLMVNCNISAKAATSMAGHIHILRTLTHISLQDNKIGDDGVRAIAEKFSHLRKMGFLDISNNGITEVGGEAIAKGLVHLQELQELYLRDNALALSLSSLAKSFANMSRLKYVDLNSVTCRATSFRMAAQQARAAVHTLAGLVRRAGTPLYDGSRAGDTQELAWQRVKQELLTGKKLEISRGQLKVDLRIRLLATEELRY